MRLLDLGWMGGLRSQTVWHAVAQNMLPDDRATLCLCSPIDAYVSLGYHRRLDEIDRDAVARRGLPVYRRRVGGGPVYCDSGQLFFQLIVPAAHWPAVLDRAWEKAMAPAVEAFQALGAPVELGPGNDLVAWGRKVSGTGAARIGEAAVFVGNVIFDFDHEAMADCLAIGQEAKDEAARLMRRYLATVHEAAGRRVERSDAVSALVGSFGEALGGARRSVLTEEELESAERLDALFVDDDWVAAERAPMPSRVKIRSGVSLLILGDSWISVTEGRVERASLAGGWAPPEVAAAIEQGLAGQPLDNETLDRVVGAASNGWDRGGELVGAIMDAYRGGS